MNLEVFEKEIGYIFTDKNLLKKALTHTSYAYEKKVDSYERLEYLGDSILEFIASKYLYQNYKNLSEGEMTKVRAYSVCEDSLYTVAVKHNFSDFLFLGKSEQLSHGTKKAILADTVEAVIAAIYLDSNLENAEKFILNNITEQIEYASKNVGLKDYKTTLQEKLQVHGDVSIKYNIISEKAKRILSEDDLIRPGYPKISSDRLYFELFQGGNNDYTDFLYHSTDLQGNDMREEFLAPSLDSSCLDQNYVYGCYPGTGPEDLPEIARVDFYDHSGNLKDSVEFPNARRTIRFAPGDDRYIFLQYDDDTYTYVDLIDKKEIGSKNIKPISFFKMETSYINKGVLAKAS